MAFVGMAGLSDEASMASFIEEFDLGNFPHTVSEDGTLWARFGVPVQGVWVFVDDSGSWELVPYDLYEEDLDRAVRRALADAPVA